MTLNITWYGHSCIAVNTGDLQLLVDPFLSGNPLAPITPEEISPDFILVSHGHGDHLGDTIAIAQHSDATVICNFEIHNWLQTKGLKKLHPLHIGGGYDFGWGRVKMTIAHHGSSLPDGSNGGNPCGFQISAGNRNIYHACDTGLFLDMGLIGEMGIDLAILPIGDNFTMGPEDALRAVKLIKPRKVLPIHYNTFDLIKQDPHQWAQAVTDQTETIAIVLHPGDSLTV